MQLWIYLFFPELQHICNFPVKSPDTVPSKTKPKSLVLTLRLHSYSLSVNLDLFKAHLTFSHRTLVCSSTVTDTGTGLGDVNVHAHVHSACTASLGVAQSHRVEMLNRKKGCCIVLTWETEAASLCLRDDSPCSVFDCESLVTICSLMSFAVQRSTRNCKRS